MISHWITCLSSWFQEKVRDAWARVQEQVPVIQDQVREGIWGFLTGPLSETEYALLKRVSGIVGTAVAVYVTLMAGVKTAGVVFGLCVLFSFGLYKITGRPRRKPDNLN